jgi:dihydroxyacetone kinase
VTRLWNAPADFADEAAEGFARAFSSWVRRVPGGVIRQPDEESTVALVIGGGSGHYPAFAGLVGHGLAHGAVMGNLFASPSAHQAYEVARAVERGQGVLFSYGNYSGDVLHFDQAQQMLRAERIACDTVTVTDDISSAPPAERHKRRGIAGDLVVFKVAGAACAAGYSLPEVARVARLANDRTRSLGVAFSGCTLPGAPEPLFTVPTGRMAVGMGVHGEPGIDETDVPSAAELAELLVSAVVAEAPSSGARVVAVLNGLGSVKYEELFVLYRDVDRLLEKSGLEVIAPDVGELVTSFDMAGVSLTLCWLDDELERLWRAPADTPAYRTGAARGRVVDAVAAAGPRRDAEAIPDATIPEATSTSQRVGVVAAAGFTAAARAVDACVDELGRLDAVAGDGDHGIGMQRGTHAAAAAADRAVAAGAGAGTVIEHAARAWEDAAGGTSGALWAAGLTALATVIGDESAVDAGLLTAGIQAAVEAVLTLGGAVPGDKTMVDAAVPFRDAFVVAGDGIVAALRAAVASAERAAADTANLVARIGRARPHAEKSVGTPDPGARSFAVVVRAVLDAAEVGTDAA